MLKNTIKIRTCYTAPAMFAMGVAADIVQAANNYPSGDRSIERAHDPLTADERGVYARLADLYRSHFGIDPLDAGKTRADLADLVEGLMHRPHVAEGAATSPTYPTIAAAVVRFVVDVAERHVADAEGSAGDVLPGVIDRLIDRLQECGDTIKV